MGSSPTPTPVSSQTQDACSGAHVPGPFGNYSLGDTTSFKTKTGQTGEVYMCNIYVHIYIYNTSIYIYVCCICIAFQKNISGLIEDLRLCTLAGQPALLSMPIG